MAERIATRVAYGKTLAALGETKNFFVMDADLSGSTQTAIFGKKFPERFINCGIAEANMISAAAGIASTGVPVFCSSFAMFACGRAYEQIRNSVAYPKLNVKICASHGGITVGEDGATHQYCEDLAVMRATPNMVVVNPADATETVAAIEAILNYDGPVYCRLGRFAVPVVFDPATYKFELGKGNVIADGKDVAIFATGIMNAAAMEAREQLKAHGVDAAIIDIHTIKPIDRDLIAHYAAKTGAIVTVEEHNIIGGLGSAVAEVLAETVPCKMARVGIEDVFGTSASAEVLLDFYKLNAQGVVEKTLALLGK